MKKLILIALLLGSTVSCEDFEGWNVDTKNPAAVPPAFLITAAQQDLFQQMVGMNVNSNCFGMMAQYWGQTTYQDEASYLFRERDVGGSFWQRHYRDMLNDLQEAQRLIVMESIEPADVQKNQLAMIEIMSIFSWHILVDTFGHVPYTEALHGNANLVPKYDVDKDIYDDLFRRLDVALNSLDSNVGMGKVGDGDLVYHGDPASWAKFANSLKLRMAVRISDVDLANATKYAGEAIIGGVFGSNGDNALYPFMMTTPNTNPNWVTLVQSGRTDYIMAEQFVDLIVPLNDPRTPVYMQDNIDDGYIGAVYGVNSAYTDYSHLGDRWHYEAEPGIVLDYAEVQFLIAEAMERGLISGDAESYYNTGVRASIEYWTEGEGDADAYLAQPKVAYTTADGDWKQVIGTQKYLALYGRGFEAWSTWRMLNYPDTFTRPPISAEPVPRRYYYPNNEPQLNGENYETAAAAMGGDEKSSKVFWDVSGQGN